MLELLTHIKALNTKTRDWVAAGPNRWAGEWDETSEYWEEEGVSTVAEFELWDARNSYSDFHKEAYGFRPRHSTEGMTLEDFNEAFDRFDAMCEENMRIQEEREAEAIAMFEERIADIIATGAKDRATAMRWIKDAEDDWDTNNYFEFSVGLPYGYLEKMLGYK